MGMIALVDSGIGNLRSVEKALTTVGAAVKRTSDPDVVLEAEKVVLPGVGAFGDGMAGLESRGLIEPIKTIVARGTPLQGICVGMQVLFEESEEHGRHDGLGFLPGTVKRFDIDLAVPHIGWNGLNFRQSSPIFNGLQADEKFYFVHSYHVVPADPSVILTTTDYGGEFVSSIQKGSIIATETGCDVFSEESGSEAVSFSYPQETLSDYALEMEAFADYVTAGIEGPTTGRSERRSLAIIQAGYESAKSGSPIDLKTRFGEL